MIWSDKEIWIKIKDNDKRSFELLFRHYRDSLCLYSYGIVKNEEVAEEIVSDIFFKIWKKREQIQITFGIRPYLFRSVFNASIDYIEQNRAMLQHSLVEIDERILQITGTNEEYIFNHIQDDEIEKDVMEAIDKLPEQQRIIFNLSRFDLLTYHEISERLNISINTVKTQISRAMDNMREKLGKYL